MVDLYSRTNALGKIHIDLLFFVFTFTGQFNHIPIPESLIARFEPGEFYHIICKAIDGKQLFLSDDNRIYFLKRYSEFLSGFSDTYAYILLDNHAHWLIRTRSAEAVRTNLTSGNIPITSTHKKFLAGECDFHELIEQQFNRFFIAYALAFNFKSGIKGHLFNRPFKRISIRDDFHFTQVVIYIHANAEKHGIVKKFSAHKWSSYHSLLSYKTTNLMREEVLGWFGGRTKFIDTHDSQAAYYYHYINGGEQ